MTRAYLKEADCFVEEAPSLAGEEGRRHHQLPAQRRLRKSLAPDFFRLVKCCPSTWEIRRLSCVMSFVCDEDNE